MRQGSAVTPVPAPWRLVDPDPGADLLLRAAASSSSSACSIRAAATASATTTGSSTVGIALRALSLEIAAITALLVVVLVLPTVVLVRLRLPKMVVVMDVITILPIVVPPIVIAAGLVRCSELPAMGDQRVLQPSADDAARSTRCWRCRSCTARSTTASARSTCTRWSTPHAASGGWTATLLRVILPNVQTAVLGGMFLTVAMCPRRGRDRHQLRTTPCRSRCSRRGPARASRWR